MKSPKILLLPLLLVQQLLLAQKSPKKSPGLNDAVTEEVRFNPRQEIYTSSAKINW